MRSATGERSPGERSNIAFCYAGGLRAGRGGAWLAAAACAAVGGAGARRLCLYTRQASELAIQACRGAQKNAKPVYKTRTSVKISTRELQTRHRYHLCACSVCIFDRYDCRRVFGCGGTSCVALSNATYVSARIDGHKCPHRWNECRDHRRRHYWYSGRHDASKVIARRAHNVVRPRPRPRWKSVAPPRSRRQRRGADSASCDGLRPRLPVLPGR